MGETRNIAECWWGNHSRGESRWEDNTNNKETGLTVTLQFGLHYGSRLFSWLPGQSTTCQHVCNIQFYFTRLSLLLCMSWLERSILVAVTQWVAYLVIAWRTQVWFPSVFCLFTRFMMAVGTTISFAFKSLHLCVFFFYWHSTKGGAQLVSQREKLKVHGEALHSITIVGNT
jgi:hypothetical protein